MMTPGLHPYQEKLVSKLMKMPRGALFLEMGLGKTAVILTLLSRLIERDPGLKFLILAPPAVASLTYPEEIRKWAPHLTFEVLTNTKVKYRLNQTKYTQHHIGIGSNMGLRWLINTGIYRNYDGIIVDESSTVFSRHDSQNFKYLKEILHQFIYRYIMTGTPIPNSYEQLWSQFYILDNGERLFKDFYTYRHKFFIPSRFNRFKHDLMYKADLDIMSRINDITFTLRMKDVALQLPPITHTIIPTDLPENMEKLYKDFKKNYIITYKGTQESLDKNPSDDEENPTENPTENLHYNRFDMQEFLLIADTAGLLVEKLLQFCSGGIYSKDTPGGYVRIHDLKVRALGRILEEHEGKALLLYRYKHERDLIMERYPAEVTAYNGKPSHIQRWQAGETPRILMSHPKSIATGLNLQGDANTIIWLGFTWDLQLWQQTNARLHRPGQSNPVRVLYLATGEMEYQLLTKLKDKDKTLVNFMSKMRATGQTARININEERVVAC